MLGLGIWEGVRSRMYNEKKMGQDIINLDQTAYHHSIIAIRDTFDSYPNRYLVYWDKRWKCWFFLNYPTQLDEAKNISSIKEKISGALKVPVKDIRLEKKCEELQHKYSESHKEERYYDHAFYQGTIMAFTEVMKGDSFTIDHVSYQWMTIEEMKNDPDIRKKNLDVVEVVERNM